LSYQRYDNVLIREDLGKLHHAAQILLGEPAAVGAGQFLRQGRNNLLAVSRALALQHLSVDPLSDAPV
jgi:hypothetical protein